MSREEEESEKTKIFRAISFVVPLLNRNQSLDLCYQISKSQILDQFKLTRIQRPELFRMAWMGFK